MPGVFEVSHRVPVRTAVEDILLLSECSDPGEWEARFDTSRYGSSTAVKKRVYGSRSSSLVDSSPETARRLGVQPLLPSSLVFHQRH